MALPVEISDFFVLLQGLWLAFPLMVRQVFYLSFGILGIFGIMKMIR